MLKVDKFERLDDARYGINFDGTIIIQVDGGGECFIHPNDLSAGNHPYAASGDNYSLSTESLTKIETTLTEWKAQGNNMMDENAIRPV